MTDSKGKVDRAKDKIIGEVKEVIGKVTGNEELELKGKIQSLKSDLKGKMNIGDKVDEKKEGIAGKINDIIDEKKDNKEEE
jgi:uncharacterized protein YjbJ (UPF0337 family)